MEERFEKLETRLAYQDKTVEALNEVVTRQQDQIDRLACELQSLREAFEGAAGAQRQTCAVRQAS